MRGYAINYEMYDAAVIASEPARWSAATARAIFGNPFSPLAYSPAGRAINAAATVFSDATRRHPKPQWNLAETTIEIVSERPFCRVLRFRRETTPADAPRVLLVAPLSGHYATLLRGTVAALADAHDVYVTDWIDARDVPLDAGRFDLDDYIEYIIDDLRRLGPDVHVVAVCQPAPAVLAAVALMASMNDAAQPRSMILMGGPVDVRANETSPVRFAMSRDLSWFEREVTMPVPSYYAGAGRKVYPGFIQLSAFLSMHPARHADAHLEMYEDLVRGDEESAERRRAFYDEYLAVMDVTAEYYLQTIDVIFQRALLPRGEMTWHGLAVDPHAITKTALMTIEGEFDDISALGQTLAAHDLCTGIAAERHERYVQSGVGHYGIFNGSKWRNQIAPRLAAFIATESRRA